MELNNLRPAQGSTKNRKRIGRGTGSGRGGTSTRGHKGDKARSGAKEKRHFEGGQTPMQRRLPKRGFQNINRVEYTPINLGQLEVWFKNLEQVILMFRRSLLQELLLKASDNIKSRVMVN